MLLLKSAFASLCVLLHGAGWVESAGAASRRVAAVRYQIDLSKFELLQTNAEEWSVPYISRGSGRVFVPTRSGVLQARDVLNGALLWERDDLNAIGAALEEYQGVLLVGSGQDLLALDPQSGREKWRVSIGGRIAADMALSGHRLIIPVRPNGFVAVDLAAQKELWRIKRPTPEGLTVRGQAPPTADAKAGRVYVGFSDGTAAALGLEDGQEIWSVPVGIAQDFFADVDARPLLLDRGRTLLVASYNGGLAKLDANTGSVLWKNAEPKRLIGMVQAGDSGVVVASQGDGLVLGLDPQKGAVRWRYKLARGFPTTPVYLGQGIAAFGGSEGPLTFIETETGRPLQLIAPGSGLSVPPFFREPDLGFISNKGHFFVLRTVLGSSSSSAAR